jgi:NAD(P)-dependent dehydrogenase (short-subunit alcohol dehydrogenase family)
MVMKELARTLAPDGIRVNAIAPGAIPGGGFVADNLGALVSQIPIRPCRDARRHCPGRCRGLVRKIWSLCRGHDSRS